MELWLAVSCVGLVASLFSLEAPLDQAAGLRPITITGWAEALP